MVKRNSCSLGGTDVTGRDGMLIVLQLPTRSKQLPVSAIR